MLWRAGIHTIEGRRERIAPAMAEAVAFAARAAREAGVTLAAIDLDHGSPNPTSRARERRSRRASQS